MYENDVAFLKRVTRATPPQFFGQPTVKNDRSQLLKFFFPPLGCSEKEINFGILSALCHNVQAIMLNEAALLGSGSCKHRTHFDRRMSRRRMARGPLQRGVEVGHVNDDEAAEEFLRLGIRAVVNLPFPVAD